MSIYVLCSPMHFEHIHFTVLSKHFQQYPSTVLSNAFLSIFIYCFIQCNSLRIYVLCNQMHFQHIHFTNLSKHFQPYLFTVLSNAFPPHRCILVYPTNFQLYIYFTIASNTF